VIGSKPNCRFLEPFALEGRPKRTRSIEAKEESQMVATKVIILIVKAKKFGSLLLLPGLFG